MELITPDIGLVFWTLIIFLTLFLLLKKFAWPPILSMLKERESAISNALNAAEKAREEIKNLQVNNERLLVEARRVSDDILRRAEEIRRETIAKAQFEAHEEYDRILEDARLAIENEKKSAIIELQNELARLSIDIAEKILREEMKNKHQYDRLIDKTLQDANFVDP
jgi:F-type H+-transporting ATPase subunit b